MTDEERAHQERMIEQFSDFNPEWYEDTELLYYYHKLGEGAIDAVITVLGLYPDITVENLLSGDTMNFPAGKMIINRLRELNKALGG